MHYNASTSSLQWMPIVFGSFMLLLAIGMLVLSVSPPRSVPASKQPLRRVGLLVCATVLIVLFSLLMRSLYLDMKTCTASTIEAGARPVDGELLVLENGKHIEFQISGQKFKSAGSSGSSECGFRASLGQSVALRSGQQVRAMAVSGVITKLSILQ